jgi:hypothetical protein
MASSMIIPQAVGAPELGQTPQVETELHIVVPKRFNAYR